MSRILLIEDDPDLASGLCDALSFEGYETTVVARGDEGLTAAIGGGHDLIVLDAMLPELSGFDLLKRLRAKDRSVPVLMLTAKGQEIDKVRGLKLGADDYVTKPFGLMELLARIAGLLRRTADAKPKPRGFAVRSIRVDFRGRRAWKRSGEVSLTEREFEVLELLFDRRGQAVPRADLVSRLWGGDGAEVSTRTVDQHVAALRRKLGDHAQDPWLIETVYGFGYRLSESSTATA